MNIDRMKGILDAIQAETTQPSPSHANLARLTHMALNEMMSFLDMLCKGIVPLLIQKTAEATAAPAEPVPPLSEPEVKPVATEEVSKPNETAENLNQPDQPGTVQPS